MQTNEKELLTGEKLCDELGIKKSTLYGWVSEKRILVTKVGRLNRFTRAAVEEFLSTCTELKNDE